jgi:hypothetical protein
VWYVDAVRWLRWAFVLMAMAWGRRAHAQDPADLARAQRSFQNAVAQEQLGAWDSALGELVVASELGLKKTPQFLYHLGRCHAHVGMLVEARGELARAAEDAESAGLKDVAAKSLAELRGVEGGVASLTLTRPKEGDIVGLTVDQNLATAKIGTPIEINPGIHQIHVTFTGRSPEDLSVALAQGEKRTMAIPEPGPLNVPAPPVLVAAAVPQARARAKSTKTLGWVLVGGGLAVAVGGGVLWGLRDAAVNTLTPACGVTMHLCPPPDQSVIDRGRAFDDAGVTLLVVGCAAALAGGGLVRYGRSDAPAASLHIGPIVTTTGGGLAMSGALW